MRVSPFTLLAALACACPPSLPADTHVAFACSADPGYLAGRMKDGVLVQQSYVFMEGRFVPGPRKDPGIEKAKFTDIARRIATDLAAQAYVPAPDLAAADLLLVVHWGVTSPSLSNAIIREHDNLTNIVAVNRDPTDFTFQPELDLFTTPNKQFYTELGQELIRRESNAIRDQVSLASAANTLGITDQLREDDERPFTSTYGQMLRAMLDEERYFVVVVAFDAKVLFESKRLKRVWTTRLSIRSPGVNFAKALDRMSSVGGQHFGTFQPRLAVQRARVKEGTVKIGDMIVITSDGN